MRYVLLARISRWSFLIDQPLSMNQVVEPVEQFRMRRLLAHHAEIARRAHQTFAEMMLPYAIHNHPRGERIVRTRPAIARSVRRRRLVRRGAGNSAGLPQHLRNARAGLPARVDRLCRESEENVGGALAVRLVQIIGSLHVGGLGAAASFVDRRLAFAADRLRVVCASGVSWT